MSFRDSHGYTRWGFRPGGSEGPPEILVNGDGILSGPS